MGVINFNGILLFGSISSLTGIIIAILSAWGLAYFSFETVFVPNLWAVLITYIAITGLTVFIGLTNG